MRPLLTTTLLLASTGFGGAALASAPAGVWALPEAVVVDTTTTPDQVTISGLFAVHTGEGPWGAEFGYSGFENPAWGVMHFSCPPPKGKDDFTQSCLLIWADIAKAAKNGGCLGWGSINVDNGTVRADGSGASDVFQVGAGAYTGFTPCTLLETWSEQNPPPAGWPPELEAPPVDEDTGGPADAGPTDAGGEEVVENDAGPTPDDVVTADLPPADDVPMDGGVIDDGVAFPDGEPTDDVPGVDTSTPSDDVTEADTTPSDDTAAGEDTTPAGDTAQGTDTSVGTDTSTPKEVKGDGCTGGAGTAGGLALALGLLAGATVLRRRRVRA